MCRIRPRRITSFATSSLSSGCSVATSRVIRSRTSFDVTVGSVLPRLGGSVARIGRRTAGAHPLACDFDHRGQDAEEDDGEDDVMEVPLHDRLVAENVSSRDEQDDPGDGTDHVESEEARVRHLADTGDERRERAYDRHEARDDDGLATIALVERLSLEQVFLVEEKRAFTPEHRGTGAIADRIVHGVPEHGGDEQKRHDDRDVKRLSVESAQGAHREEERITGEGGWDEQSCFAMNVVE